MYTHFRPEQNHLLATLPTAEFDRLAPNLELVSLKSAQVLSASGQPVSYAYFPTTSTVELLHIMENGDSSAMAVVGNEGMVGVSLFMGGGTTPTVSAVQFEGQAYRLHARHLKSEFVRNGMFQQILLRFAQALVTQIAQTAVCNRHHRLEQQLCRSLLVSIDRLPTDNLSTTHEFMATTLGVRREGVTEAAGKLQADGLIRYQRGKLQVIDRPRLERAVCECYGVVKKEYQRLLPWVVTDMHTPEHEAACKFGFLTGCETIEACRKISDCSNPSQQRLASQARTYEAVA